MNSTIDTDINNYTIDDIADIFGLGYTYNEDEVIKSYSVLKYKTRNKPNLIEFFEKCKCKLLNDADSNHVEVNDNDDDDNDDNDDDNNDNDDNSDSDEVSDNQHINNINMTTKPSLLESIYKDNNIIHTEDTDYHNLTLDKEIIDKYKHGTAFQYNFLDKLLIINSKFRENARTTQSNDFIINLPYFLENVISLKLKAVDNIHSTYLINNEIQNNFLIVDGIKITIPDGQYSESDLIIEINTQLSENGISNITASLSDITSKVSFAHLTPSTTFGLSFEEIETDSFYNSLGYILGFRDNPNEISDIYISDSLIDINAHKYFYVSVDDYIHNSVCDNIICFGKNDFFYKNILGRVEMKSEYSNKQFIDNRDRIDKVRFYNGTVNINKFRIRLFDEQGRLLQNNNTDYSITLEIRQKINK